MTDPGDNTTIDLGADLEERKRLSFWHRGRLPINRKILRCGRDLSGPEKLVLLYVIERAGDGVTYARQLRISEELGMDRKTTGRALQLLEDRGFIVTTSRPDNRAANQYTINLGALYDWADMAPEVPAKHGAEFPTIGGTIPHQVGAEFPTIGGTIPHPPTNRATETLTATSDSPARVREAVDTLRLTLGKTSDEILGGELRLIVEAHGADLVLETAARMGLSGPPGRRKPWPSALLEWLPDHPAFAEKVMPRKGGPGKPYVLNASEVGRRNAEASASSYQAAFDSLGATPEQVAEYERLTREDDAAAQAFLAQLEEETP